MGMASGRSKSSRRRKGMGRGQRWDMTRETTARMHEPCIGHSTALMAGMWREGRGGEQRRAWWWWRGHTACSTVLWSPGRRLYVAMFRHHPCAVVVVVKGNSVSDWMVDGVTELSSREASWDARRGMLPRFSILKQSAHRQGAHTQMDCAERERCACGRASRTFTDRQKGARQRAYMRMSASARARGERLTPSLLCLSLSPRVMAVQGL